MKLSFFSLLSGGFILVAIPILVNVFYQWFLQHRISKLKGAFETWQGRRATEEYLSAIADYRKYNSSDRSFIAYMITESFGLALHLLLIGLLLNLGNLVAFLGFINLYRDEYKTFIQFVFGPLPPTSLELLKNHWLGALTILFGWGIMAFALLIFIFRLMPQAGRFFLVARISRQVDMAESTEDAFPGLRDIELSEYGYREEDIFGAKEIFAEPSPRISKD